MYSNCRHLTDPSGTREKGFGQKKKKTSYTIDSNNLHQYPLQVLKINQRQKLSLNNHVHKL